MATQDSAPNRDGGICERAREIGMHAVYVREVAEVLANEAESGIPDRLHALGDSIKAFAEKMSEAARQIERATYAQEQESPEPVTTTAGARGRMMNATDTLDEKLDQLCAGLAHTFGQSREGFEGLTEDGRQAYMAMCSAVASDCVRAFQDLKRELYATVLSPVGPATSVLPA